MTAADSRPASATAAFVAATGAAGARATAAGDEGFFANGATRPAGGQSNHAASATKNISAKMFKRTFITT